MAVYVLDSSAAVKLYVRETGSFWLRDLAASLDHHFVVVRVTPVEIAAAVFRRVRGGSFRSEEAEQVMEDLRRDLDGTFSVIEINATLVDLALDLARRRGLRGYDCIQLAGALLVHGAAQPEDALSAFLLQPGPAVFLTADRELTSAAEAEGLTADDPNRHGVPWE